MKLPREIKFGCFTYRITGVKNLDGGANFGKYMTTNKEIIIDPSYSGQISRETLFHEILHLLLDDVFVIPDEMEEILVSTLSPRIMELLQRNPKIVDFLLQKD